MSFYSYLNDKKIATLVSLVGALFFLALLWLFGLEPGKIVLLWICFICIACGMSMYDYLHLRKRIAYLRTIMDSLDQKYLFAEIAEAPQSELEKEYFKLIKTALKAMTDEVSKSARLNDEYREFVEQWVHEIKVPITGIELLCENNKSDVTRKIMTQTELLSQGVERVLYYARLGTAEKDYFITEVSLKGCVLEVLARNKQFLIQNNVCVYTDNIPDTVYSDQKWLQFIFNQIMINSVKYQGDQPLVLDICSQDKGSYILLSFSDNGIGIKQSEIGRVFDKGFVGSNGRAGKKSTGMGLYLCKQLCSKLGIDMKIESEWQKSTTVCLYFPKSDYLNV